MADSSLDLRVALEAGVDVAFVWSEQDDVIFLVLPGHAGRTAWHTGNREALRTRTLGEQSLDCFRRHMTLNQISTNLGGVTGRKLERNTKPGPHAIDFRCFNDLGLKPVQLEMSDPTSAASTSWIFVNRDERPCCPGPGWENDGGRERKTCDAPCQLRFPDHVRTLGFVPELKRRSCPFATQMCVFPGNCVTADAKTI